MRLGGPVLRVDVHVRVGREDAQVGDQPGPRLLRGVGDRRLEGDPLAGAGRGGVLVQPHLDRRCRRLGLRGRAAGEPSGSRAARVAARSPRRAGRVRISHSSAERESPGEGQGEGQDPGRGQRRYDEQRQVLRQRVGVDDEPLQVQQGGRERVQLQQRLPGPASRGLGRQLVGRVEPEEQEEAERQAEPVGLREGRDQQPDAGQEQSQQGAGEEGAGGRARERADVAADPPQVGQRQQVGAEPQRHRGDALADEQRAAGDRGEQERLEGAAFPLPAHGVGRHQHHQEAADRDGHLDGQGDRLALLEEVQLLVGRDEVRRDAQQRRVGQHHREAAPGEPQVAQLLLRHHQPGGLGRRRRRGAGARGLTHRRLPA